MPKVWGYGFLCLLMILCNCCFFPTLYFYIYIYNMHGWSLDVKIESLVKRWNSCLKPGAAMDSTLRLLAPLSAETKCPRSSCLLMCLESWMKPSWTWVPNWQLFFFGNFYFHLYHDTESTVVSQIRQLLRCLKCSKSILKPIWDLLAAWCLQAEAQDLREVN